MRDNNVYVKEVSPKGGIHYRPFGIRTNQEYLPDGIWLVRHTEGCYSTTNVDYYLSNLYKVGNPELPDIPKICGMHIYTEKIFDSEKFKEFEKRGNYTLRELVATVVNCVFDVNESIKNDKKGINKLS